MKISKLHIVLVLVLIAVAAFAIFSDQASHEEDHNNNIVACTTEAKICPDGTTVGRIAPDCEFAPCPNNGDDNGEMIGGQRDEHGCLSPAGYTFVESIGACAREWEIKSEDKIQAAKIAVEHVGFEKGLTVIDVEVFKCVGCFKVNLDLNGKCTSVSLTDWKASSVNDTKPQIPDDKSDNTPISIESNFGTKIVYGTSQSVDTAPLIKDCEARGGTFNTCGSPCESEAEMCIDVCAFTCESISTIQ